MGTLTDVGEKMLAKLFGAFHAALGTNMLPGLDFTRKSNAQKRSNIFFEKYVLEKLVWKYKLLSNISIRKIYTV